MWVYKKVMDYEAFEDPNLTKIKNAPKKRLLTKAKRKTGQAKKATGKQAQKGRRRV